jgi:hypothetical protein
MEKLLVAALTVLVLASPATAEGAETREAVGLLDDRRRNRLGRQRHPSAGSLPCRP